MRCSSLSSMRFVYIDYRAIACHSNRLSICSVSIIIVIDTRRLCTDKLYKKWWALAENCEIVFLAKFPSIRIRSSKRNTFAFEFMRVDNPQLRIGFWKRFVRLSHSKLICYKFRMHLVRGWHLTFWGFIGEMSMVLSTGCCFRILTVSTSFSRLILNSHCRHENAPCEPHNQQSTECLNRSENLIELSERIVLCCWS